MRGPHVRLEATAPCLFHINPYNILAEFTLSTIVFCSTLRIGPYLFYIEKFTTQFKTTEKKMIGHRSRFRENHDLSLWRGPAVKKKPPFSNARALPRVKLCAVGMRNAILGNHLNIIEFYKGVTQLGWGGGGQIDHLEFYT